jgi:hypothetical protein
MIVKDKRFGIILIRIRPLTGNSVEAPHALPIRAQRLPAIAATILDGGRIKTWITFSL